MSIIIKNGLIDGQKKDLLIKDNKIVQIHESITSNSAIQLNAENKAIIPGLLNGHTHAAMSLFRGFGDDMELHRWLNDKIWPLEAKITEEDVYWGTKLACLEMIKSGTTFFNDMYWHWQASARAVEEMGLRAALSGVFIDLFDENRAKEQIVLNEKLFRQSRSCPNRIQFCLGPHAIYTVSEKSLLWAKKFADDNKLFIHIHLSESKKEVEECLQKHKLRPVEYLDKIGFLGPTAIIAHAIWLNDVEMNILKERRVGIITNPTANMKLSTGIFQYSKLHKKGVIIGLGTDGVASNNNFDLFEEMKFLSLLEKAFTGDPTSAPAPDVFETATKNVATIFNLNCGEIREGKLADILLIDLNNLAFVPGHNFISDLVYAANGPAVVDTVICDGKILMKNKIVEGEEEIIEKTRVLAHDLVNR